MTLADQRRHAGHRFRRLRLSRPPCGARAGQARATASASRCAGPELAGHLQPLGRVGQIHAVQANLRYPRSVEAAARDADVVINLVGILFERGRQRFDAVQGFGAEQVALAAAAHGARMVHVSAIGADENSPSRYARSKAAGERRARGACPAPIVSAFDRVRAGGRFLQPLRRDGAHSAGAAAGRRRRDALPAGVCRRRRGGDRARGRRQTPSRARPTSSAGRRCARFKQLMEYVLDDHRAHAPAGAAAVRAREVAGHVPAIPAEAAADARSGRAAARATTSCRRRPAREGRTLEGLGIDADRDGSGRADLSLALPQGRPVPTAAARKPALATPSASAISPSEPTITRHQANSAKPWRDT